MLKVPEIGKLENILENIPGPGYNDDKTGFGGLSG